MTLPSPYAADLGRLLIEEASVDVAGAPTAYWIYGSPTASTALVLVHGFRGEHHGLEPVIARLLGGGADVRVVAPDLPGFGASPPMTAHLHDVGGYTSWLNGFLDALGLRGSAVVLGHSFGSIIAAAAVANGLPTPLLVLVNPIGAPALAGPRGALTRLAVLYYRLAAVLPRPLGDRLLSAPPIVRVMSLAMVKTRDPSLRRFVHDQHDRYFSAFASRDTLLEAFRASVSHDVGEYASRIAVPTQLIAAAQDDITPLSAQYRLLDHLAHGRLHVIDGVGHLIHYEKPDEAAAVLRAALEEGIDR
ncbi:alpha/beta fold hydrolase [Rathayibacter iranicus]|uniref:Alpha/beta hydrolase n=2 Tax=Rathayibacter iranicus TaxID=59737 RepID=A0AAD1ADS2_9MICO|nr:alpha/beta hydrolase [Rathayibacter iranicus]AZZ55190.1 alpha/beta hydrolase [Rathayibacter iranicus]MWV31571.1 alpha/beta fold hydrolase [Rathayibacter iranicus NCPPB 2253 = VKM Ac-1602]PPI49323.1 alpha/beta hydrolase [Rathayibacter iranicus]PPI61581.1 alpha/beta hydrolase [Rathayibacter iranicus]PPI72107.1 alpha/beta hydrolase [Rathayibacter iranicus]